MTTNRISQDILSQGNGLNIRRKGSLQLAVEDLVLGLASYNIWSMLGWEEVKQRYRRSLIGPFWLTLSTAIMVVTMGPLYGKLFGQTLDSYFGYLATSIVVWGFISQTISESCQAFIGSEGFIKQMRLPYTIYVLRIVWKGLIIFAHNLVVVLLVFLFLPPKLSLQLLLFPVGILAVSINAVWMGMVIGLVCARFRDIPQIVTSLVGVAFFLTPIMWQPQMLGRYAWTVNLNPFFHLMEVIRGPLLGSPFRIYSWLAVAAMIVLGYTLMLAMFSRFRSRIAYWV